MDDKNEFAPNPLVMEYAAKAITRFGEFYNGYEIKGIEHVPKEGGALIVFYHGLVPLDFWYFGLKLYLETGRHPSALIDRWLFNTPGLAWFCRAIGGVSGEKGVALKMLKEGRVVGVSPGGTREAISGRKKQLPFSVGKARWICSPRT